MNISKISRSLLVLSIFIILGMAPLSGMNKSMTDKFKSLVQSGIKRCTSVFQTNKKQERAIRQTKVDLGVQSQIDIHLKKAKQTKVRPEVEIVFGEFSACGKRRTNEDAHTNYYDPIYKVNLFCLFDGHGGDICARYMAEDNRMALKIIGDPSFLQGDIERALYNEFLNISNEYCNLYDTCGSTANVVLINKNDLYVANTGDSRVVAAKKDMANGQLKFFAERLSRDFKPGDADEMDRITNLGGKVIKLNSISRIVCKNNLIAVSRSLGDKDCNPYVIPDPFIKKVSIDQENYEFIISACDGLWDVMSDQDAVNFVCQEMIDMNVTPKTITQEQAQFIALKLGNSALNHPKQQDNVTIQVIFLK